MSLQLKNSTTSTIDPNFVLKEGQIGIENRENKTPQLKIGNGTETWSSLSYPFQENLNLLCDGENIYSTSQSIQSLGRKDIPFYSLYSENIYMESLYDTPGYINISMGVQNSSASTYSLSSSHGINLKTYLDTANASYAQCTFSSYIDDASTPVVTLSMTSNAGATYNTLRGVNNIRFNAPVGGSYTNGLLYDPADTFLIWNGTTGLQITSGALVPKTSSFNLGNLTLPWSAGYITTLNSSIVNTETTNSTTNIVTPLVKHDSSSSTDTPLIIYNQVSDMTTDGVSHTVKLSSDLIYNHALAAEKIGVNYSLSIGDMSRAELAWYADYQEGQYMYSSLGTKEMPWHRLYLGGNYVNAGMNYSAISYENTLALSNADIAGHYYLFNSVCFAAMPSDVISLGTASYKWNAVYALNGTIQTSDRSAKSDIHYIDEPQTSLMSLDLEEPTIQTSFTTVDIIAFVKKLSPATFVYGDTTIQEAQENNRTEQTQLGLIADDIKDEPLFNYVGATMKYVDEETNETKTTLGLKPIPLATLALTACKYLINKVESLEEQLNNK